MDRHEVDADFDQFAGAATARLRRAARMMTLDQGRADDLVQHALEKTYLHWAAARENPYAYARRTMANAATDWWRRIGRHERLSADLPEPRGRGADEAQRLADRQALEQALATLTRRERTVLVLRFYEDLTEEQTAAALGLAIGTIKSTAHRALKKLRASTALRHDEYEELA